MVELITSDGHRFGLGSIVYYTGNLDGKPVKMKVSALYYDDDTDTVCVEGNGVRCNMMDICKIPD